MAGEIRRILKIYDDTAIAPTRLAVMRLTEVTKAISGDPQKYDLCDDPSDAEKWSEAGGDSYGDNQEFPELVGHRWLEVLKRPDFAKVGYDKVELTTLDNDIRGWAVKLATVGLELGSLGELEELLKALIAAAPEPESDSDDDDDDDDSDEE